MKKVTLIIVMFFGTLLLTSCTDTSKELEERLKDEKLIENSEIGDDDDDEQQEGQNN